MAQPLTIKIPIKNKHGDIVGEREVVSYAGLLAKAHDEGLESISTELRQIPTEQNGMVAIVVATVKGRSGSFGGIGDADPTNVHRGVVRHLVRIAETRAKARALRDYINIGVVSLEELGGDDDFDALEVDCPPVTACSKTKEARGEVRDLDNSGPCSDAQRRLLWRLALALGHEGDAASAFLAERLGAPADRAPTKREASKLIDVLEAEVRRRNNGNGAAHA